MSKLKSVTRNLDKNVKKLAEANEELRHFAYAASHDLREPLRTIAGFNQLIERRYADKLDGNGRRFIRRAIEGAERMQHMLDGILTYSRLTTHPGPAEKIDSNVAIEDVKDSLARIIKESGARIEKSSLPLILADRSQVVRLFQNLIENAIKFRGQASPHICISVVDPQDIDEQRRADLPADRRLFKIEDNGIGIAPEFHERIFTIFQRLSTRDEGGGNGIGLALCRRIVERHGGAIWLESQPGSGTSFYFSLPEYQETGPHACA